MLLVVDLFRKPLGSNSTEHSSETETLYVFSMADLLQHRCWVALSYMKRLLMKTPESASDSHLISKIFDVAFRSTDDNL